MTQQNITKFVCDAKGCSVTESIESDFGEAPLPEGWVSAYIHVAEHQKIVDGIYCKPSHAVPVILAKVGGMEDA